jgi:riboflavin kinase/FMN adenylyltransferase
VVTIGNFDGVHRGHREVLARLVAAAAKDGAAAVAVTFDPHPSSVHAPDRAFAPITALEDRLALLETTGLDAVLVIPYTIDFAATSPERFVIDCLVGALGARRVIVGRDVRFGNDNGGDLGTMAALGARHGFAVDALDDLGDGADGARQRWSSTEVRELIAEGDVDEAARLLGRPHRVRGTVVHGDGRGRELGFPTANLGPDTVGMVPKDGVYAGWLVRLALPEDAPDRVSPAAVSVGANPTFGGKTRRVEACALGRDDLDLYGEPVAVDFVARLRHTLAYGDVDALVTQMRADVGAALRALRLARR